MKLFVIEGVDGAGKSTQIKLLKKYFSQKGYICEYLHFPRTGEPFFGELIARFLRGEFGSLNEVSPWLVAMLYAGDRKDASDLINGWLKKGSFVLLDRYTYSNIAYQCAKLQEPGARDSLMKWILDLEFRHFGIPRPDLNIFLDVPFSFTEKNYYPQEQETTAITLTEQEISMKNLLPSRRESEICISGSRNLTTSCLLLIAVIKKGACCHLKRYLILLYN